MRLQLSASAFSSSFTPPQLEGAQRKYMLSLREFKEKQIAAAPLLEFKVTPLGRSKQARGRELEGWGRGLPGQEKIPVSAEELPVSACGAHRAVLSLLPPAENKPCSYPAPALLGR